MQTFWLYIGTRLITSVRLPEGSSKWEARNKADKQAKILFPGEPTVEIWFADVVTF